MCLAADRSKAVWCCGLRCRKFDRPLDSVQDSRVDSHSSCSGSRPKPAAAARSHVWSFIHPVHPQPSRTLQCALQVCRASLGVPTLEMPFEVDLTALETWDSTRHAPAVGPLADQLRDVNWKTPLVRGLHTASGWVGFYAGR
jgi:hypothetical protein